MKTPHKHAALIKAWADGAEIEQYSFHHNDWGHVPFPSWKKDCLFRIKPEPKPDTVRYGFAPHYCGRKAPEANDNIKFTFDGETGKLKSAEVIS